MTIPDYQWRFLEGISEPKLMDHSGDRHERHRESQFTIEGTHPYAGKPAQSGVQDKLTFVLILTFAVVGFLGWRETNQRIAELEAEIMQLNG